MKIGDIIFEEHNGVIKGKFKNEYIGKKGIWALYGKRYVCDKPDLKEERKYAKINNAVFWRNGRPYKSAVIKSI